jgi:8-amino-7-oxononanoate synthase
MSGTKSFGLSSDEKARLIERFSRRAEPPKRQAPPEQKDLAGLPLYDQLRIARSASEALGIADPFFRVHEGRAGARTVIDGQLYDNFSSYDYLGLNARPEVAEAAKAAIDRFGVSASASRLVAGERPLHRRLEARLADFQGAEACVTFVSGHAANVTVIGRLFGRGDLILHDELIHNSIVQGGLLSGARRLPFAHNDPGAAAELLEAHGRAARRILIAIEGHYSMDGDLPDLPAFVELKRRFGAWLLVDEAHALGVVGATGRGLAEHCGVDPAEVDLWMGTLSKTLAACGGYFAGRAALIDYLKLAAPGFVYSVAMSPPVAAAALAALDLLEREPERVRALKANAGRFLHRAKAAGLDVGLSQGLAIVPIMTGSSIAAGRLSDALFRRGINVQPILHPAVPERSARLRFFLSAEHDAGQIDRAVDAVAEESARLAAQPVDLASLARVLGAGG